MDLTTDNTRTESNSPIPRTYISLVNQMQFVEIFPSDETIRPHPRSGHRAVATESDLWIWGGYNPSFNLQPHMFNELWRFNFALQRWTQETTTGDAPTTTVASHCMHLYGDLVLVYGGTGFPFGQDVSNELHVLNLKRLHWKRYQFTNQRSPRVYGASMFIRNDHLYILCGTDAQTYNTDVYDIHLPTLSCTQIGHTFHEDEDFIDNGRYRQEVYLHKNQIYVFGGGGVSGVSFSLKNLPVFDLTTRTWSFVRTNRDPVHNYPPARKFHSIFPFRPNQAIIFGGTNFRRLLNLRSRIDPHLWVFDFERLTWSRLPSLAMIQPTYFHAAAMNERGEIWSHGGVVCNPTQTDAEERITNIYKMNTKVLKLSELCWDLFLQCLSDRSCLIRQPQLMQELRIPQPFIKRVY